MTGLGAGDVVIEARGLRTRRGRGPEAFELRVDHLSLRAGEVLAVVGPNGSGKTTLLRTLAGLDRSVASSGTVPTVRSRGVVTLVFQRPAAFAGSVAHNVAAALWGTDRSRAERSELIASALERFGIAELATHDARTLSGGELRRLALARAFVLEPEGLLLDEPFDDLDGEGQRLLSLDLKRAVSETGVALAVVTHDLRRALLLADRIAVLIRGRLVQLGPRDEVLRHPATPEVARTVGMSNLATGLVVRSSTDSARVDLGGGLVVPTRTRLEAGCSVWVGIRPEHLKIDVGRGEGEAIGIARVESLVDDGLATVVGLSTGSLELTTHLLAGRGLARSLTPGDVVTLAVRPEHVHAVELEHEDGSAGVIDA